MMQSVEENKPAKKRTAPREVRRKQLILAAMDSISKRGFAATTLKHVTEKAKLSHGVVNYHFESKEALYDATLGFLAKEHYELWVKRKADAGDDPSAQLVAIIQADFDKKVCTTQRLAVWFAFWGQAKYRPNYLKIHSKYDEERYEEIGRLCEKIIDDGNYENLKAESVTRSIEALIDGTWLSLMLYPSEKNREMGLVDCYNILESLFPKHFNAQELSKSGVCHASN